MGMTDGQRLRLVELPLALPVILAGVRIAAVVSVGTATIAAAIGAGGLGTYVFRGHRHPGHAPGAGGRHPRRRSSPCSWTRCWPGWSAPRARPRGRAAGRRSRPPWSPSPRRPARAAGRPAVVVGSKNFTEQVVLGEILAAHPGGARVRGGPPAEPGRDAPLPRRGAAGADRRVRRVHRAPRSRTSSSGPWCGDSAAVLERSARATRRWASRWARRWASTTRSPWSCGGTTRGARASRASPTWPGMRGHHPRRAASASSWSARTACQGLLRDVRLPLRVRRRGRWTSACSTPRWPPERWTSWWAAPPTVPSPPSAWSCWRTTAGTSRPTTRSPSRTAGASSATPACARRVDVLAGRLDAATMRRLNLAVDGEPPPPADGGPGVPGGVGA